MSDQKHITENVRRILWQDWDPINVRAINAPADEYDSYVPTVVQMLTAGASVDALARHLNEIEGAEMGLKPDAARGRRVATTLAALRERARTN